MSELPTPSLCTAVWRTSSHSGGSGQCVEVAALPGTRAVRDSKNPTGPALVFTAAAFERFLAETKRLRQR